MTSPKEESRLSGTGASPREGCALDPRARQQVEAEYVQAGLRRIASRHRVSMRDRIQFFETMAQTELRAPAARQQRVAAFAQLRESL